MLKKMILAGAACASLAMLSAPAAAQTLLNDWAIADVSKAIVAAGATVTDSGVTDDGEALYVNAETSEGMKFLAYGTVCSGTPCAARV